MECMLKRKMVVTVETPLVEGKECAFALFEENGVVKCSIEKAFNEKKISWQKPISCHLYFNQIFK